MSENGVFIRNRNGDLLLNVGSPAFDAAADQAYKDLIAEARAKGDHDTASHLANLWILHRFGPEIKSTETPID